MVNVTKKYAKTLQQIGGVPYGNSTKLKFKLATNASGVLVDGDQTTALVQTNVARLGVLPAGADLIDALAIVSDAFTASVTFDIGFAYVDGVDDTAVPQDDNYFFDNLANSAGRTRANNTAVAPVKLPKDAWLIATVAGADNASAGVLDIVVETILNGAP